MSPNPWSDRHRCLCFRRHHCLRHPYLIAHLPLEGVIDGKRNRESIFSRKVVTPCESRTRSGSGIIPVS